MRLFQPPVTIRVLTSPYRFFAVEGILSLAPTDYYKP